MIHYIESEKINRDQWDHCVSESNANLVYGYSWYLDLVTPGWCGIIEDDYSAVMPLPVKKKYGIKYIIQPVYTQQLGIFSNNKCDQEKIRNFLNAIPEYYRFIDIHLNYSNYPDESQCVTERGTNFELNLFKVQEEIIKGYSENTRRNIRKANRKIIIKENISVEDHIRLVRKNSNVYKDPDHYKWMKSFIDNLIQQQFGWLVGGYLNNELCASVFLIFHSGRIYFLIPVSTEKGKRESAMFAIVDYIIGKNSGKPIILDFEGSNLKGIARFFSGFGATSVEYSKIMINRLSFPYRLFIRK